MVLPILLYGCKIWGYENIDIIKSIYITFLKYILPVKKGTPLFVLYGELGRNPLKLIIQEQEHILKKPNITRSTKMPVMEHTDSEEMAACYKQTMKDSNKINTQISKILQGLKSNQREPPINNQPNE